MATGIAQGEGNGFWIGVGSDQLGSDPLTAVTRARNGQEIMALD